MGSDDGRAEFHTGRHDPDSGASSRSRCARAFERYWASQETPEIPREGVDASAAAAWFVLGWRTSEATARHEAVDGLHPRDAEKKA